MSEETYYFITKDGGLPVDVSGFLSADSISVSSDPVMDWNTGPVTASFSVTRHKGPRMQDPMRLIFREPYIHPRQVIRNGKKP